MRHLGKLPASARQKQKSKLSLEAKFASIALFAPVLFMFLPHYIGLHRNNKVRFGENKMKRAFLRNTAEHEEDLSMTIITRNAETSCACDIVSTDCLNSISCMPKQDVSQMTVARGILLRRLLKKTAKFEGEADDIHFRTPIGKGFQYKTIQAWQSWVNDNTLPLRHPPSPDYVFLNNTLNKKFCSEHKLVGFDCYFTSINEQEEFDSLEEEALPFLDEMLKENQGIKKYYRHQIRNIQAAISQDKGNEINALDHLRMMAHILRMMFNRKGPLRQLSSRTRLSNTNANEESSATPPLRVSIHMRRADACMADPNHLLEASPLDSPAQQFLLRKCYATSVYMDALKRLKDTVAKKDPSRRIEVFVSSDDASSLLDEISDKFAELYRSMTWRIIDFDRQRLDYQGFVEDEEHDGHGDLGDAALSDLWLLSNGEVFIGHLGSRFGKIAYLLATARHNRFIPFFSVDGHSLCCEIDEPCGKMKPYIKSMNDCLTFSHDLSDYQMNEDYHEVGSYMRKRLAEGLPEDELLDAEWVSGDSSVQKKLPGNENQKELLDRELGSKDSMGNELSDTELTTGGSAAADDNPWADLTAPIADYKYFPETRRGQSVEEPVFQLDQSQCQSLVLDTSPPQTRPPSNGACHGFDGVLLIQQGDFGGGSTTIFFLFVIAQLQYAEQHNLKPWVHLNSWSRVVYDPEVHSQGSKRTFTMMEGMKVGWARDARDSEGNLFPGRPVLKPGLSQLQQTEFSVEGTGVWEHYFLPVSDFSPGDPSCENKPLLTMDDDRIAPGLHSQSPWAPRAWRVGGIEYIERHDLDFDVWIEPKRRNAAIAVRNYIRFNAEIQQRAHCAHPKQENSLGLHIRHSDKETTRDRILVSAFLPYARAFVKNGGGSIYVATDSSLVLEEIGTKWPTDVKSHVTYQKGMTLSRNETATFELGVSHHRINVEALTEALALSKCTYLVHGFSAMSEAAMYLNPSLIDRSVNLEHQDQNDEAKYTKFLNILQV